MRFFAKPNDWKRAPKNLLLLLTIYRGTRGVTYGVSKVCCYFSYKTKECNECAVFQTVINKIFNCCVQTIVVTLNFWFILAFVSTISVRRNFRPEIADKFLRTEEHFIPYTKHYSMGPVGCLRCLQNLLLLFLQNNYSRNPLVANGVFKVCCYFSYKTIIRGTRWLLTVSSKSVVTFLTNSESMRPVGYLRCPQQSVVTFLTNNLSRNPWVTYGVFKICCYFSYKQWIDETRGLLTVSSTVCCYFSYKTII